MGLALSSQKTCGAWVRGGVWLSCLVVARYDAALAMGGSAEGVCAVGARMRSVCVARVAQPLRGVVARRACVL